MKKTSVLVAVIFSTVFGIAVQAESASAASTATPYASVSNEYIDALANDPQGNLYAYRSDCAIELFPAGNPGARSILPGTATDWCTSDYSDKLLLINFSGHPTFVISTDLGIFRYDLPSNSSQAPRKVVDGAFSGASYDASTDTLYVISYLSDQYLKIPNFSACNGGTLCEQVSAGFPINESAPGIGSLIVANGKMYTSIYNGVGLYSISLTNPSDGWVQIPDSVDTCGDDCAYNYEYWDSMAVDTDGNVYVTCNYYSEITKISSADGRATALEIDGTPFANYNPVSLSYFDGNLYTVPDNAWHNIVKISVPVSRRNTLEEDAAAKQAAIDAARHALLLNILGKKVPAQADYTSSDFYIRSAAALARVNADLQVLQAKTPEKMLTLDSVKAFIEQENIIDLLSNPDTRRYVLPAQLVKLGLLDAKSPNKAIILRSIRLLPSTSLDSYEKVQVAIAQAEAVIKARADRLAASLAHHLTLQK